MTTITYDPQTNWGFTLGSKLYTGYTTRDAAAEALYDLGRGEGLLTVPEGTPYPLPAEMDKDGDWKTVIGEIDSCPVTAWYSHHDLMFVEMEWHGYEIAWNGTHMNLPSDGDLHGDMSMDLWGRTKELIQSGVGDQLIALAKANDPAPRIPAPCSRAPRHEVRVTHWPEEEHTFTDYRIGDIILGFMDGSDDAPNLVIRGVEVRGPIDFDFIERLMVDLVSLLADSRVRAAVGAPPLGEAATRKAA